MTAVGGCHRGEFRVCTGHITSGACVDVSISRCAITVNAQSHGGAENRHKERVTRVYLVRFEQEFQYRSVWPLAP